MRRGAWSGLACSWLLFVAGGAAAYPLDGDEHTGIVRLRGYREQQERLLERGTLAPGALLPMDRIVLSLEGRPGLEIPPPDEALSRRLRSVLGPQASRYAVSVLDLSDPAQIRYLAHQEDLHQNPGSVGKLIVALAWMQALADRFPADPEARAALLRTTEVVADAYIRSDEHEVPFWAPGDSRIVKRRLREGDRGSLYTYLDWMLSSSSNAAASMLLQQLVLFRHFGERYPTSPEEAESFLTTSPIKERQALLEALLIDPIVRNGLDPERFRQGGLFTHEGKRRIPGGSSTATTRELVTYLLRMEQGRLVDRWSSLELKRLLYLTDRRIRYASHPALRDAAIYFKSGSLYSCEEEEGFVCRKYHGNVRNYMNSVAIVEVHDEARPLRYLVAVLSNVLRENSAVAHQTLALRIHRLIESLHPVPEAAPIPDPPPPAAESRADRTPEAAERDAPTPAVEAAPPSRGPASSDPAEAALSADPGPSADRDELIEPD
ncbi:MAG: serine hydrolase [Myxococcales bacterium]|nr:serine hydrolase [Myxococcales bacterium]